MARRRRKYSPELKQEAVRLVSEEEMSCLQVSEELGIPESTIRSWCQRAEAVARRGGKTSSQSRTMEEELAALRREVRQLREEREILKKAAAFFAKESR